MSWHTIPRDDAWRQVTLAHIHSLGQRLWINCACHRERLVEPLAYAVETGLDPATPLLSIALRLRCSACGTRRVAVQPEPYGIGRNK